MVTALVVALTLVVLMLAFLVLGLLRSNAELTRGMHQLGFDVSPDLATSTSRGRTSGVALTTRPSTNSRPTPRRPGADDLMDLTGATPAGAVVSIAVSSVAHDTLVAFLTSGCQTCHSFWTTFREDAPQVPGNARLVVVTRGSESESPAAVAALAGDNVSVVMSSAVWEHYDTPYAPYFVYISAAAGKVMGEGVASNWSEVHTLVSNAVADGTTKPNRTGERLRRKAGADVERESVIDAELRAAGLVPGDPRLHPTRIDYHDKADHHNKATS